MPDLNPLGYKPAPGPLEPRTGRTFSIDARPDKEFALRPATAKAPTETSKIKKATEDFESLLLGQMLQSIRESAQGGWQEHDQSGAVAIEMAETQLAQVMASQGGLGIARTLQASLAKRTENSLPATAPKPETKTGRKDSAA